MYGGPCRGATPDKKGLGLYLMFHNFQIHRRGHIIKMDCKFRYLPNQRPGKTDLGVVNEPLTKVLDMQTLNSCKTRFLCYYPIKLLTWASNL